MKKLLLCVLLLFASLNGLRAQEVITGETIVTLLEEKFTEREIISIIEAFENVNISYNLQLLRALKAAGASEQLISYLSQMKYKQKESAKAEEQLAINRLNGVYWHPKPDSAVMIPYNLCTLSISYKEMMRKDFKSERLALIVSEASQQVGTQPLFRFYLSRNTNSDEWFSQWFPTIANPNEFLCIRLTSIKDKKARVFPAGLKFCENGIDLSKSEQSAIDCIVEFNVRQYDETTYEVTFPQELSPGEYCFFYKNLSNEKLRGRLVVFDFSVK